MNAFRWIPPSRPAANSSTSRAAFDVADLELELTQQLVGLAEEHHRVVVVRYVLELLERVDGGVNPPQGGEVARHLLLNRGRNLHQVARRDVARERD